MPRFLLHFVLPTSEPQDEAEAKGVGGAKEDLMKEGPILLVPLLKPGFDWTGFKAAQSYFGVQL